MDIVNIIILISIAISGTVFGSFFTLAVHRIPRGEDITHERSYCPNCNHKLNFLDLIPVWSYIFLGGKCRYCKNKIRPRYLILEICSGLAFLLMALIYKINITTSIYDFSMFALNILFICAMYIIAGIDKEHLTIPNGLIIYGLIIGIIKCIVMCVNHVSIYFNIVGFLFIPIILLITNLYFTKFLAQKEAPIGGGDIKYIAILGLFFGIGPMIIGLFFTMIIALIFNIIQLILKKAINIPLGFYLSIGFTLVMVILPLIPDLVSVCNSIAQF